VQHVIRRIYTVSYAQQSRRIAARLGYVERVPDPSDRRAKLVRATPRGRQLYAIAREVVVELEAEWTRRLGKAKMRQLRELLEELNAAL
jgi:DNA-binding MarR family transcriptional regulator